jgi:hypothetical protein
LEAEKGKWEEKAEKAERNRKEVEAKEFWKRYDRADEKLVSLEQQLASLRDDLRDEKKKLDRELEKLAGGVADMSLHSFSKSIRHHGFPALGQMKISDAPSSTSSHYPVTSLAKGEFCMMDQQDLPLVAKGSILWSYLEGPNLREFCTEADIGFVVRMALENILKEVGFSLSLVAEMKKFFTKPDFFVEVELPVGAVEVKKPGSVLGNRLVLGEVFDQLMHLKNEWMISAPFVLLTTYNEWRVCWLNDEESNALAGKECFYPKQEEVHPGVDTPKKAGQAKSPPSSPERHNQRISLGKVRKIVVVPIC